MHVDQLRVSLETGKAEAAQIARAAENAATRTIGSEQRAVTDLALIAGTEAATVRVDNENRALTASAAPLPGGLGPGRVTARSKHVPAARFPAGAYR